MQKQISPMVVGVIVVVVLIVVILGGIRLIYGPTLDKRDTGRRPPPPPPPGSGASLPKP